MITNHRVWLRPFINGFCMLGCLLFALSAGAAVSLDRTIKADGKQILFENITAMLPGKEGTLLVVDADSGRMTEFKGKAGVVYALTGKGRAFASGRIGGMTRRDDASYIVSSTGNDAVALVASDGKLIRQLIAGGSDQGQLNEPAALTWSANRRLYVADRGNGRISVFGTDGVFIQSIGASAHDSERLQAPEQVAVDPAERVYVLETHNDGLVSIYSHDGRLLKRLGASDIRSITGSMPELSAMAVDNSGLLYLADNKNGRVYQIDWQAGRLLFSFGSRGEQRGQFGNITSLAVLPRGQLAVADSGNAKIEIYRLPANANKTLAQRRLPTVGYERSIPLECDMAYRLQGGNVLCLDNNGNRAGVFNASGRLVNKFSGEFPDPVAASVVDQDVVILDGDTLKIYRLDGNLRYQAGGSGSAEGKLDAPRGVFLHGDRIYVADTANQRIQIFSSDGIYLQQITNRNAGEAMFSEPGRVLVDSHGNLYVLELDSAQVLVLSPAHKLLYKIGGDPVTRQSFETIYDIAIDADDNLYLLAATARNPASIHVYAGPTRIITLGAASEQRVGMQQPATLSIAAARKTVVSVFDKDRNAMQNYKYMQLPARPGGLVVNGSTKQTKLSWKKVPGSYISRYKVYASREADGPFRYITDVDDTRAVITHKGAVSHQYYRVSAVSGFSVEGEPSNVREDAFQAGYALYRDRDFESAANIFYQAYQQNSRDGEILKYLGHSLMQLERSEDAVTAFRELSLLEGYQVEGLNGLIAALVDSGDYVAARAVVDKVITDNNASIDSIVYCGELSLRLGDAIGAVTCLEQALAKQPNHIKAHFLIGKAYIKLGITDKGLAEFEKAVAIDPANAEIWYQSGLIYQEMNRHRDAVTRFNKALEIDATLGQARIALAHSQLALKQYDQVRTIAIKLAGNSETAADGDYLLGVTALASGQHGQALLSLTKATRAEPANTAAWLALVDTHIKMNQHDKVRAALVSAVQANPRSFDAAYRLGVLDYEAARYADAIGSLDIAAGLEPDHYDTRYKLADARYRSGQYQQAAAHAQAAARLKPDSPWPLVLQASIANKQGKNGQAIDLVKQAMQKQKNSVSLHTRLGALYVENSMFDLARSTLEKAALLDASAAQPHALLGSLYMQRRMFDEAIAAYDKAVQLDPSADNKLALDTAYAEKKNAMAFNSRAPQIVLKDVRLDRVFSAAYKQYVNEPVGYVHVHNASAQDYANLRLTFAIKGYMDFPATTDIPLLKANSTENIALRAIFNNRILEIDEDTGVQVEIAVNFLRDGRNDSISITQPMTIYGKNAIVWGRPHMVGSFVTPKDDTLRDFVRQTVNENKPDSDVIHDSLLTAMTLFDVFTAHGIRYLVDPNSPYANVSENTVDYVQFSRETLKLKSGDCDDLSVLMSSALENMGIETAIIDVPGHLLMMFNTGLSESEKQQLSLNDDLLVVHNASIWIPLEVTMIGTSFEEAWAEGARKYRQHAAANALTVIPMRAAWSEYQPVTLKPAAYTITVPDKARVAPIVQREKNLLLEKTLDRLVAPYRAMVSANPSNTEARMQVAIIYARHGLHETAEQELDRILEIDPDNSAVFNNRGNIYFSKADYERAIENYSYAEKLAGNDAGVKMNLSMAHYRLGDLQLASAKYQEAAMIDSEIEAKYGTYIKLLSH